MRHPGERSDPHDWPDDFGALAPLRRKAGLMAVPWLAIGLIALLVWLAWG